MQKNHQLIQQQIKNQQNIAKVEAYSENNKKIKKKFWTKQQDKILKAAVLKYGDKKWSKIAELLKDRHPKRCRERWFNYVSQKKTPWKQYDDWLLYLAHRIYGNKWSQISRILKKGDNIVKNKTTCIKRGGMIKYSNRLLKYKKNRQLINSLNDVQKKLVKEIIQKEEQKIKQNKQYVNKLKRQQLQICNENKTRQQLNQDNQIIFINYLYTPYNYFNQNAFNPSNSYVYYW